MIDLKNELYAAPEDEWHLLPLTEGRHTWWMRWCRLWGRSFYFGFESPRGRTYSFWAELDGKNGGRVTDAEVTLANGETIASYWGCWGDKPERLDVVIRLTPRHILDRLSVLLDAIG